MPSPAQEAHAKEIEARFATANAAILANATPSILYTHHVMEVRKSLDKLGRIDAISQNHHNSLPVLARLVDDALFAMRACVDQANRESDGEPVASLPPHHQVALALDAVPTAIANGDYNEAARNVRAFMAVATRRAIQNAEEIVHATHGAAGVCVLNQLMNGSRETFARKEEAPLADTVPPMEADKA